MIGRVRGWWDGLALTGPERTALVFFAAALLVGSAIEVYRRHFDDPLRDFAVLRARVVPEAYRADSAGVLAPEQPVDLNRATAEELETLPGIGPVLARRIVARRGEVGDYAAPEDLLAVPGIGPRKLAELRPHVTVGPAHEGE